MYELDALSTSHENIDHSLKKMKLMIHTKISLL